MSNGTKKIKARLIECDEDEVISCVDVTNEFGQVIDVDCICQSPSDLLPG